MEYQKSNISKNNFEECTKCTICTVYCPVIAVNPQFPGPKQGGPDVERLRLKNPDFFNLALKYCLNCKRCEVSCPSNVKIGDIIQSARQKYDKTSIPLRDMMLASTDEVGTLANVFAPIVNATLGLKPVKKIMQATLAIDDERTFPKYSSRKFTTWFRREAEAEQARYDKQVAYFHGCYVQYNFPKLGQDFVKIMNAIGYGVRLLDKERCCGVAKMMNRLYKAARRDAETNIASIRHAVVDGGVPVLGTSSTCLFTIRDEYPHILGIDNHDVRESVMLATKFIYELVEKSGVKLVFRNDYRRRIAYHSACHMEKLGWVFYSTRLMGMIPGVRLTMLDSCCCGIAGTYGFKHENYKYSQAIGAPLFEQIRNLDPDCVSTDCETCKWQIEMSTGYNVENPVSILADALDVEATRRANGLA